MSEHVYRLVVSATDAESARETEIIQSLWSGYGTISRYHLVGAACATVIVKHVKPPTVGNHPRGWNTTLSHQRKIQSYHVETSWYQNYSQRCDERCRVPHCFGLETSDTEFLMILEDLDASGFAGRRQAVSLDEMNLCLAWLANFHATFLHQRPEGLWPVGTYWHLDTRPDELAALEDKPLKAAANAIDRILRDSPYQTLVHGDAKLANFCFSEKGEQVAAVDFQYVGGGCGMKDVAYFIGSCLHEADCEAYEQVLLDGYFVALRQALSERKPEIDGTAVEQEWRALFPVAWADFHRFVKGWSPGHWKIHDYSERLSREVVNRIKV